MIEKREDKVASLIAKAEKLEADGAVEAVAEVMADLRSLAIFRWRGMPASLSQRINTSNGTLKHDKGGWYFVYGKEKS
jgi:hypothetical protein